jgi:hypothetical protein
MTKKTGGFMKTTLQAILIQVITLTACLAFAPLQVRAQNSDPCANYQAWQVQVNPRTDPSGSRNVAFPETNATYWGTILTQPVGTILTINGQFSTARYMSFQIYDGEGSFISGINDVSINPDPGQNNPYRGGIAQGTYTVRVVFGRSFDKSAPNTIWTSGQTNISIVYRVYHPTNPDDLTAGTTNPVLPALSIGATTLTTCPPRPIITPVTSTVWGRLGNNEFSGVKPSVPMAARIEPLWSFSEASPFVPYPNHDNDYMSAALSRDFLKAPYNFDIVVMRFKLPTYANTQNGMPPYAPAQVRYASLCSNDPISTAVARCLPDNQLANVNDFVTVVISDPSKRPSETVLSQWGASWMPWGALGSLDSVYGTKGTLLTNANGVFYYDMVMYRQTMSDPSFAESITNVSKLPASQRKAAMGEYWPTIGYCTNAQFQSLGARCLPQ